MRASVLIHRYGVADMNLNLGLIGQLLNERYEFLICNPIDRMIFNGVVPWFPGQNEETTDKLYMIRWKDLRQMSVPVCNAICIGGGTSAKAFFLDYAMQGFIFPAAASELSLLSEFQAIFARYTALEINLLSAICSDAPTRKILNCVAEFFQCSVLLFDNDFDLLENSDTYIPPESNTEWHDTIRRRHSKLPVLPRKHITMLPSRPNDYPQASYIKFDNLPEMFMAGFESSGSYFVTMMFMQVDTRLTAESNWLVDYLCKILKPALTVRFTSRQGRRSHLRSSLRWIFLNRNISSFTLDTAAFRSCGWLENDLYRLILIKLPKESSGICHYQYNYENVFAASYPEVIAFTCDDYIIIMLHNDACVITEDVLATLENQLRLDDGICSIGLKFCGMRKTIDQYLITRIPFNMYENDDRIRYYKKIMPKHLLTEFQAVMNLDSIYHWAAEKIYAYDTENETDYLYSLEMYLLCNRSLNDAANMLYIHKSTMYYRIKCIEKIVHIDMDDPYERLTLLLSCMAIRQMNKYKHNPKEQS